MDANEQLYQEFYDFCRKGDVVRVKFYLNASLSASWTNPRDRDRSLLMATAWKDSAEVCTLLIEKSAPLNHQDASRMTALHICAKQNARKVAKVLLQCPDINPNLKAENGLTPLMICADLGHTDVGRQLLDHSAIQLNLQSDRGFTALMKAVFEKSIDLARLLIEKGARLDLASQGGFTALHLCAQLNRMELAKQILSRQPPGNSQLINLATKPEFKGNTAFALAALNGHIDMLKLLKEKAANIFHENSERATALDQVLRQGVGASGELVQLLKEWYQVSQSQPVDDLCSAILEDNGARVQDLVNRGAPASKLDSKTGLTPLMIAADRGNKNILSLVLNCCDVNAETINLKSDICGTALHAAIRSGKDASVQLLLDSGASLSVQDASGWNPLHLCAELNCSSQIVKLLLDRASDSDVRAIGGADKCRHTPTEVAAMSGSLDALRLLLKRLYTGKDVVSPEDWENLNRIRGLAEENRQFRAADLILSYVPSMQDDDELRISQLFTAALERSTEAVKSLLAKPCMVRIINARCRRDPRWTALMATAWNDDLATCELLLKHGADPNVQDEKLGVTALHIAIQQTSEKVASRLLRIQNIDINVPSSDKRTPLIRAAWLDRQTIGKLLQEANADVDARELDGFSALHFCAQENLREFAMMLINHGANLELETAKNRNKNTAFTLAVIKGHKDMIELLANVGANIYHKSTCGDAMELVKKAKCDSMVVEVLRRFDRERNKAWISAECSGMPTGTTRLGPEASPEQRAECTETDVCVGDPAQVPGAAHDLQDALSTIPHIPPIIGQEYPMRSNPRGLCVIINNERFPDLRHNRSGSQKDVIELTSLFQDKLKFRVQVHLNLDARDIMALMKSLASNDRHNNYDCFAAFIMTHGNRDVVLGSDGREVALTAIYDMFRPCSSLFHKPKLFFLQACRVHNSAASAAEANDMAATASPVHPETFSVRPEIPASKLDFLFSHAVTDGDFALRNTMTGSLYVQTLCKVIAEDYKQMNLISMLTKVRAQLGRQCHQVGEGGRQFFAFNVPCETNQLQAEVWFR